MLKTLTLLLAGLLCAALLASCVGEGEDTSADNTTDAPVTTTTTAPVTTTTGGIMGVTTTKSPDDSKVPETDDGGNTETPEVTEDGGNTPAPGGTTNVGEGEETPEVTTTVDSGNTNTPEVTTTVDDGNTNTPETPETPAKTPLTWYDNNGDKGPYYVITEGENGAVNVSYTMETAAEALATNGYEGWSWVNMASDVSEAYNGQAKFIMKIKGDAGDVIWIKPFDDQAFEKTITLDGSEQTITFELGSKQPTNLVIIIFGGGAKPDTAGQFTILDAYFE